MANVKFPFPVTQMYIQPANTANNGHGDYVYIVPQFGVAHEVASPPNVQGSNFIHAADIPNAPANFHEIVDKDGVYLALPVDRLKCAYGWHALHTANGLSYGIEMSHYTDKADFDKAYQIYCARHAYWLCTNDWDITHLLTHHQVTLKYPADHGDHTDPDSYFASYGITIDQFMKDVQVWMTKLMAEAQPAPAPAQPVNKYYHVFAGGKQIGDYTTVGAADEAMWSAFNGGENDAHVVTPEGYLFTAEKHPEFNPKAYKLTIGGKTTMYNHQADVLAAGWTAYNGGAKDAYYIDPTGAKFTFDAHPDLNPVKPAPTPTPQPTPSGNTTSNATPAPSGTSLKIDSTTTNLPVGGNATPTPTTAPTPQPVTVPATVSTQPAQQDELVADVEKMEAMANDPKTDAKTKGLINAIFTAIKNFFKALLG